MIVGRSMHERWLSNAYVVGDARGGTAVFVDSGAPLGPLLDVVEREQLKPTHVLRTHGHPDHVEHENELCEMFGIPVVTGDLVTGGLTVHAIPLPGHSDDGIAFVVNGEVCFSGDVLFKDAVGGGPADVVERSVMEGLMTLPPELRVLPGHTEETTIGRELERNPFVAYWRGAVSSLGEQVRVAGDEAELVVWSPDYDGNGKALVRFDDGREAIVGGSRVERS
jgi:glyoxylase-like metal-dependent hydrolase (beta-lactamase superfamily II)